jgi:hypothetical protein
LELGSRLQHSCVGHAAQPLLLGVGFTGGCAAPPSDSYYAYESVKFPHNKNFCKAASGVVPAYCHTRGARLSYLKTPWSRNQIVALAQLTRLDTLYQATGEDAAATVQLCTNALRERAAAYGGKVHPSSSHQTLVTFHNPRRALDWVEQTSNLVMTLVSSMPLHARPAVVVGFDYADTTEIEGALHSVAVARVERLTWGRNDELVFTQAAVPVIPDELKGRISRVPAPKDLGSVWRIGVKETSVMSPMETQQLKLPSRMAGLESPTPEGPRPMLTLEVLDRKIEVGALDAPMIFGRGVAEGLEIPDPRVSRLHAIIEPRGTVFVIVDSWCPRRWSCANKNAPCTAAA